MKTSNKAKLFGAIVLLSTAAFASAGDLKKEYTYHGDDSARAICLAIAKDQPNRLKRALRNERVGLMDNKVHTRYSCNGEDLLSFANRMNAQQVSQMLTPKFEAEDTAMEVVSIGKK